MAGMTVAAAALIVLSVALFTGSGGFLIAGLLLAVASWRMRW